MHLDEEVLRAHGFAVARNRVSRPLRVGGLLIVALPVAEGETGA